MRKCIFYSCYAIDILIALHDEVGTCLPVGANPIVCDEVTHTVYFVASSDATKPKTASNDAKGNDHVKTKNRESI